MTDGVFIQAMRDIRARRRTELRLQPDDRRASDATLRKNYECRCGSENCRGTMLGLSKRQMQRKLPDLAKSKTVKPVECG